MPKKSSGKQKVSFVARKKVTVPARVSFTTKSGQRVSFAAKKKVPKPVRVTFYRRSRK